VREGDERGDGKPPLFESKRLMRKGEYRIHGVLRLGA